MQVQFSLTKVVLHPKFHQYKEFEAVLSVKKWKKTVESWISECQDCMRSPSPRNLSFTLQSLADDCKVIADMVQ